MFEIADWIGLTTLLTGLALAFGTAFWQWRRPSNHEAEEPYQTKPIVVSLHEEDRERVDTVSEKLAAIAKALDGHGEIVGKHRHAVGDQTAEIRRQTRD